MFRKISILFLWMMICWGIGVLTSNAVVGDAPNKISEIQSSTTIEEEIKLEILSPLLDEIELKQKEMRDPTVLVQVRNDSGSGTIIDCVETGTEGIFEYRVLTNTHVTQSRLIKYIWGVNFITGEIKQRIIDTGCLITIFDHLNDSTSKHKTKVIIENIPYDVSILSFMSDQKFAVANIADCDILERVRVFDEIFVMGCQLGQTPSPTIGIISRILTEKNGKKEWIIYTSTAQISPGSSGGGLYKKSDDHYYLIGVPFRMMAYRGQWVPHLAHAISIATLQEFIDQSLVSYP